MTSWNLAELGETKMGNSSVPVVALPFVPIPVPPLGSRSAPTLRVAAGAAAGTAAQPAACPCFSHPSDPLRSLPPRGITQQGQIVAATTVLWLSYSNLPHLLPLHTQACCAVFNRWKKGTLWEINWLPVPGLFPALHWICRELVLSGMCAWGGLQLQEIRICITLTAASQPSSTVPWQ